MTTLLSHNKIINLHSMRITLASDKVLEFPPKKEFIIKNVGFCNGEVAFTLAEFGDSVIFEDRQSNLFRDKKRVTANDIINNLDL